MSVEKLKRYTERDLVPGMNSLEAFYRTQKTPLNNYPLEQVLGWLTQDIEYVQGAGVPTKSYSQYFRVFSA